MTAVGPASVRAVLAFATACAKATTSRPLPWPCNTELVACPSSNTLVHIYVQSLKLLLHTKKRHSFYQVTWPFRVILKHTCSSVYVKHTAPRPWCQPTETM